MTWMMQKFLTLDIHTIFGKTDNLANYYRLLFSCFILEDMVYSQSGTVVCIVGSRDASQTQNCMVVGQRAKLCDKIGNSVDLR